MNSMGRRDKTLLTGATIVTLGALALWRSTGGDIYTKYQVVEQTAIPTEAEDPLAGSGFYDSDSVTITVARDEFRFGLLPTPQGLLDKHIVSLVTVLPPLWLIVLLPIVLRHRREAIRNSVGRRVGARNQTEPG